DLIAQGKCMFARSGVHLLDVGIIKLDNNQGNIELWREHSQKLERLAVENRVHKCKNLTTGIRAATGTVVAGFPLKVEDEIPETADYGSNEQYPSLALSSTEDNLLQTLSQSSTEDNLVEEFKEKDKEKLIDFLQKQNLFLSEKHFETLHKKEIVGHDFIKMDKQDFKECGLELGLAIRFADFVKKFNDQMKNSSRARDQYKSNIKLKICEETLQETTSEESTEG
ncbi:21304_t:CDS:2, partial [Gigaspora margarita]